MASALDLQLQVRCTETDPRYGRPLDASACGGGRRALTLEIGLDPPRVPGGDDEYPEGGLEAWLVVLGAWCAMVPTTGMINTFGVLQAWVARHELAGYSEPSVGWIFSIHAFIVYFAGAQAGSLFDVYGVKPLVIPGSVGVTAALMCFSASKAYYQFLLSFGFLGGLSSSLLFTPSISAIGHWFQRRRALATGIAFTGGSMGGVIFPLVVLYLAPKIGFPWAIRAIGFLSGGLLLAACFLLRTRLPLSGNTGVMIDLKALRNVKYGMTTLAIFFIEFAVFIPLTYISSYAIHAGIAPQKAYRMVAFLNAASILGRAVPGYFADRFGRFNIMTCTSLICSLFIFTLWLLGDQSEVSITAFALMFGFWSGTAIGLGPVCVAQVCRTQDLGKRNGTTFAIASFGALIGIPVAGAILNQSGTNYSGLIMFGGALYAAGSIAFAFTRGIAGGWALRIVF